MMVSCEPDERTGKRPRVSTRPSGSILGCARTRVITAIARFISKRAASLLPSMATYFSLNKLLYYDLKKECFCLIKKA